MQKPLNAVLATLGIAIAIALFRTEPATAEWNKRTLVSVTNGLNTFWGSVLRKSGVGYRYPRVYIHVKAGPTPCSKVDVAQYCPATNTVHLVIGEMSRLAFELGDSAAYIVLAHEYGHSVQRHLGLLNRGIPQRSLELQADCLAGTFFKVSKYAGVLEPGDLKEGMVSAFVHGDDRNPNHHGTRRQRLAAFTKGFTNPKACF